jgi:hypothetical protein
MSIPQPEQMSVSSQMFQSWVWVVVVVIRGALSLSPV